MPLIYMDVSLFAGVVAVVLITGLVVGGFWMHRRSRSELPPATSPPETKRLLQLMARADHTLESHLTAILGNLYSFGEELPSDLHRWEVSRGAISNAADQMRRHIRRLRLIRIGLDEANVRIAPLNFVQLIEGIMIELEPSATARQVTLRMEVQGGSQTVPADPEMVEEIFTTLLDNAIRHNPPATEVVAEISRPDKAILVKISDNGKGMAPELVARAFDEGVRDRGAGGTGGTGMGLYIAKLLVELQEGTIHADSEQGKGTAFSITLPLTRSRR